MSPPVRSKPAGPAASAAPSPPPKDTETVRRGDTWKSVADRVGVPVEDLQRANPRVKSDAPPVAGQDLAIPRPSGAPPAAAPAESPAAPAAAESAPAAPRSAEDAEAAREGHRMDEARLAAHVQGTGAAPTAAPATPSQHVEDAMAAAGPHADDKVLAGAASDMGSIRFGGEGDCTHGRDRLRDVYRNATGDDLITPRTQFGVTGQPKLYAGKENGKPKYKENSWCGIYATDVWKRAGVNCKWVLGTGLVGGDGKPMPRNSVPRAGSPGAQEAYRNIKPGDIITINTTTSDPTQKRPADKSGPSDLNHHAIVKDRVFEVGEPPQRVTCPPEKEPADGKVVGFHTYNGNMGADPSNPERGANCEAYVPVAPQSVDGKDSAGQSYEKRISGHYPLPGSSQHATAG